MNIQPITQQTSVEQLGTQNYNATVVSIQHIHDELLILRLRPDRGIPLIRAGQYTVLGLGDWEPRAPDCQDEGITRHQNHLIRRAYSISCPILDGEGIDAGINDLDYLEFYVRLIRRSPHRPPALTPRLFLLKPGSRIYCSLKLHGRYAIDHLPADANVVFAATGTGEAPHNAMTAQLLQSKHRGRIASVTCARYLADLGYLKTHRRLESQYPQYRYIALTTREPENLDATRPDYTGKKYVQEYFTSDNFQPATGLALEPSNTHVFLCGNPEMIGAPVQSHDPADRYPKPVGMVETLEQLGFQIDKPHDRGNIHFEKYW